MKYISDVNLNIINMPDGICGACGTPMRINHYRKQDCHHCYPENFFGFITVKLEVKLKNSGDVVDSPVFEDQGVEVLAQTEEA